MDFIKILSEGVFACGATLFFALALRAPKRTLLCASCLGFLGQVIYSLLKDSWGDNFAVFTATCAVCFLAELFTRLLKAPATVISFPAMIPLVPGVMLYRTMLCFSQGDFTAGTTAIINTLVYAGCMAMAITLAASVSKNILMPLLSKVKKERRPD